jgi:hypothetical protein
MGLRPTKSDEDISRADPLDPLFGLRRFPYKADEGVGCGPGGPPHLIFTGALPRNLSGRSFAVAVR